MIISYYHECSRLTSTKANITIYHADIRKPISLKIVHHHLVAISCFCMDTFSVPKTGNFVGTPKQMKMYPLYCLDLNIFACRFEFLLLTFVLYELFLFVAPWVMDNPPRAGLFAIKLCQMNLISNYSTLFILANQHMEGGRSHHPT